MKKKTIIRMLALTMAVVLTGCGTQNTAGTMATAETTQTDAVSTSSVDEITENTEDPEQTKKHEDALDETQSAAKEDTQAAEKEKPEITNMIPTDYITAYKGEGGTIEKISYMAKDYTGDGEDVEKFAYVYLPEGYDESKQYNVLYLMHGIGGSENEWGLNNPKTSKVKKIMDNLIGSGAIEPFIIVTPNGKALACTHEEPNDLFYLYGYELKHDLIPYIEGHYSTYAEYDENGYDLSANRRHRAMAGLSMGGMQTINIGICESLDTFSWFGAFSAAPTSYSASKVAGVIDASEYDVDFFYNLCGTEDNIAYGSASNAAKSLATFSEKMEDGVNFMWQEKSGGHDFNIWYLGLYNFALVAFNEEYGQE